VSANSVANSGTASALGAGLAVSLGDATHTGTPQYAGTSGATNRPVTLNAGGGGVDVITGSSLALNYVVSGIALTKTSPGTLVLGGTVANTYTGLTTVLDGTLQLNKGTGTGGVVAFGGSLTIGNSAGNSGSPIVQDLQQNQLPTATFTIYPNGVFDVTATPRPSRRSRAPARSTTRVPRRY
jgi:autotransporter-associated beta strand protein